MSKKKRDRVWREVEAAIHSDARVQETSLLFHGEQQTMWEWTGPVKLPSDIFSPGRTPTRGNVEDYIRVCLYWIFLFYLVFIYFIIFNIFNIFIFLFYFYSNFFLIFFLVFYVYFLLFFFYMIIIYLFLLIL